MELDAKSRILALDVGKVRIGVAVSDELGITAQGLDTIIRRNRREDLAIISRLAEEKSAGLFLIGNPVNMSGKEGRQAEWVRQFADGLAERSGLPVKLWDERLTSVEAGRVLRVSGVSIEKRARAVDRLSAVILLQSYLDSLSFAGDLEPPNDPRRARRASHGAHRPGGGIDLHAEQHCRGRRLRRYSEGGDNPADGLPGSRQNGVIRHPLQFLIVRALRPKATLKAGEYRFTNQAVPWEVFDRIARGDIFYYTLVVPEGNNTYDIAASLEHQGIMPAAAFLEAAHSPAMIKDLDPRAPTLEGYLFPDTYRVTRHMTPAALCLQMTERFRRAWQQLGPPAAGAHDTVTLASLVEKEAKLPAERPLIASVFVNRLRDGMALQCDPTTIYAALVEKRYRGTIYRSDLESRHLYNTYQHVGLPPGPIANPGLASLKAALTPEQSGYLYFVARPDGSGGTSSPLGWRSTPSPSNNIGVASAKPNKRTALHTLIDERRTELITEALFTELMEKLAPVSESYLRRLLRETGIPLAPLVEGVRQESFDALERSLLEFELAYREAFESGNAPRARAYRQAVITAKDHARFSLRSPGSTPEQRAVEEEMLLWMLTWLENPASSRSGWCCERGRSPLPHSRDSETTPKAKFQAVISASN